jgi:Transforming growth factor beta like domain/TGF-beta propeptide
VLLWFSGGSDVSSLSVQYGRHVTRWSTCLFFNVSDIPVRESTRRAELYLPDIVDDVGVPLSRAIDHVTVYQVVKPGGTHQCSKFSAGLRRIDTVTLGNGTRSETVLTVTSAVRTWIRNPSSNYGLVIQWTRRVSRRKSRQLNMTLTLPNRPYLMTYGEQRTMSSFVQDNGKYATRQHRKRSTRTVVGNRIKSQGGSTLCRRRPLYVDFAEIGWHTWIVAPPGYQAYYCGGECPFYLPDTVNPTNHAIIQSQLHSIDMNLVPKPCCVPTKLSPISILQTNSNNNAVILKSYAGMVVEECGCR